VFIENAGMTEYHLASVADRIVMDPEGMVTLPGYSMERTYLTTLAKKVGLGIEEYRFKEYKSAMESVTRHNMSPEDREQRQALVDEYYGTTRGDVAASRDVDGTTVDSWVDDLTIMLAQTALEEGLVDKLARWESIGAPADKKPRAEDIITADMDEDVNPMDDSNVAPGSVGVIDDVDSSGEPFDASTSHGNDDGQFDGNDGMSNESMIDFGEDFDPIRPFEGLPQLPEDLQEAFDSIKVAILNHKVSGWRDVPCDNVLTALNALKAMIMAPSGD
jgi:hypothetical protein